jgi:hypothetical protein
MKASHQQLKPVTTPDEALVPVQREWSDWRVAQARMCDLEDVHWFQPPNAPRDLIHAYVRSETLVSGFLGDAQANELPERILVCVIKRHTTPETYAALTDLAAKASVAAAH